MTLMPRLLLSGLAALAVAGCSTPPPVPLDARSDVPLRFSAPSAAHAPLWPASDWWVGFRANELTGLEEAALSGNLDLAAAAARVDQTSASARSAGASLWPSLGATVDATRTRPPGVPATGGPGSGFAYNSFNMGFQASYQLDFWGLQKDRLRLAEKNLDAARYAQAVVGLTISANVANEYFTALALRERITVTRRNIASAHEILQITEAKVNAGVGSNLALSQEQAIVLSEETSLPQLVEAEREARYALALLLGRPPEGFDLRAVDLRGIVSPPMSAGLPSELLARRPDIAQMEAELGAAHANVDAARAAFFPQIGISANSAYSSASLATLLNPASLGWSIGASLVQTIFDGGKLSAESDLAKAQQAELLADYRKTVFHAFSDVETALGSVDATQVQLGSAIRQQQAAAEAFRIADVQYRAGTIDILSVLQSQQVLFNAENVLDQSRLQRFQADVNLYQALGGGWTKSDSDWKLASR